MVEYIALGLVLLKYALDFFAPKTKTKVDDVVRDVVDALPLPSINEAGKSALDKLTSQGQASTVRKAPEPGQVTTRDHRVPPPR